ncbi:MAG: cyclic nucleotide-binding domain-containing protein [Dehalococcoidia bacterium]
MNFFKHHQEKAQPLSVVPLFKGLNQQQLELVAENADEVRSRPGEVLIHQGHLGHEFILIVEGKARVERDGQVINHLQAGDYLGEIALIDGHPRTATVITEEPSVLLTIQSRSFNLLLDRVPGLQRQMLMTLCARLRQAEDEWRRLQAQK